MKRNAPVLVVSVGLLALIVGFVWYSQAVLTNLRHEATQTATMYGSVISAMSDTATDQNAGIVARLALIESIKQLRVPVIVTGPDGKVQADANLPFADDDLFSPHVRAYADTLDAQNAPVKSAAATIHVGNTPLINGMRIIPVLMISALGILLIAGVLVLQTESRAERERTFAGMARESAHQLGTPLSSLHGWIELLRDRDDPMIAQAIPHMESDVERLERVAHRFERIGRPPRSEQVDVADVAAQVTRYFEARVPTLANRIDIRLESAEARFMVASDRVLLEWAIESLVKNAIDALAGRGGSIRVSVDANGTGGVRVRVADDGPGVPSDLRRKIFSAGFSTKESGWGIGLALTRRIVEAGHGGKLRLLPSDKGAVFEIDLPA